MRSKEIGDEYGEKQKQREYLRQKPEDGEDTAEDSVADKAR